MHGAIFWKRDSAIGCGSYPRLLRERVDVSLIKPDGDAFLVPIRLGVKDPSPRGMMTHVEIQMTAGEEGKTPYIILVKPSAACSRSTRPARAVVPPS